jgi:hypothetical protein
MKTLLLLALAASGGQDGEEGFRDLFNGKDLSGWVPVNTAPSTWTVREGMIICSGRPTGEIRTDRMYQNFILEVEWRHMKPRGNAGIFVWADDITARGVPFHRSIEVQVLENAFGNTKSHTTHGDIFPIHGAKMTPLGESRGMRAFPSERRSKPTPGWNHYRIVCDDGAISLAVNGKVVTRGKDCSPRKGYICLESEGGIVHYRNLRIKELPDTPVDPKHVAIADRGYRCLYNGVDLSGWKASGSWKPRNWRLSYTGSPGEEERSIETKEAFGDFGFIFDVIPGGKSGACGVLLRGAMLNLDPEDPLVGKHLAKERKWVRFEGTLRGDRLTLSLNGREVLKDHAMDDAAARGPIQIVPGGPIDFANLYVRELKD